MSDQAPVENLPKELKAEYSQAYGGKIRSFLFSGRSGVSAAAAWAIRQAKGAAS